MRKIFLSVLATSLLPLLSYAADIHVDNNTSSFGTGHFNTFIKICSSTLGDRGLVKPKNHDFVIPESMIRKICGSKTCEAFIYDNQSCDGSKVAVVTLNANTGVQDVKIIADTRFSKEQLSPTHIKINEIGGTKRGWNWLKSLF